MEAGRRNVAILAGGQALTLAASSTTFSVSALAGRALAPRSALSTLPMTCVFVGTALATLPVSLMMKRVGRRAGFTAGALVGAAGVALSACALYLQSFSLFCLGMLLFGVQIAAAQYYRFAAADTASKERTGLAISLVLGGGVFGGLLGPEVSKWTVDLLDIQYAGAHVAVVAYLGLVAVIVQGVHILAPAADDAQAPARPLSAIAAQPAFVVAVFGSAVGFGVMNLLMIATPLAMSACGHSYGSAAFVIQWHMVAMYAPSFFTGALIQRAGVLAVMFAGVVLLSVSIAIALAGVDVTYFWAALVLLGVGWNFLYVGTTTLLTETYTPSERAKSQGLNELLVSTTLIVTSATSGWLVTQSGWSAPNHVAAPLVLLAAAAILWLMARRRARVATVA